MTERFNSGKIVIIFTIEGRRHSVPGAVLDAMQSCRISKKVLRGNGIIKDVCRYRQIIDCCNDAAISAMEEF